MNAPLTIGLLLYPDLTQLDLTGPFEVFARMPDTRVLLVARTLDPVLSDRGLALAPTTSFADCPALDIICVPGGPGQIALMEDQETLDFLRAKAQSARYITSVCTGSLVLGAAGLLQGYRAACHWLSREQLTLLGADPVPDRVVVDRNRITGGGVTAGIDFALALTAELFGAETAKEIQLQIEYDPAPPFQSGSPRTAEAAIVARVHEATAGRQAERLAATQRAASALDGHPILQTPHR